MRYIRSFRDYLIMTSEKKLISEHAKLVFEGELVKVHQWEQEMFDGSKAIFEKVWRPDSVEVIAVVGDKVIIIEQEQPFKGRFMSFPGGRVDDGEAALDAARRELLEETGYVSGDISLWEEVQDSGIVLWKRSLFIARDCRKIHDGTPDVGEKIRLKFIDFDELLMLSEDRPFRTKCELREMLYFFRLYEKEREEFKEILFGK